MVARQDRAVAVGAPYSPMQISIILPVLNEADHVIQVLHGLCAAFPDESEIIVVDGGSNDETPERVERFQNSVSQTVILRRSPKGRARQMNAGAQLAQGHWLLFLHADTSVPNNIAKVFSGLKEEQIWGRFDVQLDARGIMFRVITGMINLRSRLSGIATGDQGIFVRRDVFAALGGFPDQPLMEDIEISKRLKRLARPVCVRRPKLVTSARKWQKEGVWPTIMLMWRLRAAYAMGAPASELVRRYYR